MSFFLPNCNVSRHPAKHSLVIQQNFIGSHITVSIGPVSSVSSPLSGSLFGLASIAPPDLSLYEGAGTDESVYITDILDYASDINKIRKDVTSKFGFPFDNISDKMTLADMPPRAALSYLPISNSCDYGFPAVSVMVSAVLTSAISHAAKNYVRALGSQLLKLKQMLDPVQYALACIMIFSKQTAIVRHYGNASIWMEKGRYWTLFSDWETCVAKLSYTDTTDLTPQITPWLTSTPTPRSASFYAAYLDAAVGLARKYFTPVPLHSLPYISYDEFLNRPELWGTTGTGYTGLKNPGLNKWGVYAQYDTSELRRMSLNEPHPPTAAVQKPELTKVRAVISAPVQTYLLMSYVDYILTDTLANSAFTTTLMNDNQLFGLEERLCRFNSNLRIPVDQSHFDWQPDAIQIGVWIQILLMIFNHLAVDPIRLDVGAITKALLANVSYPNLKVRCGGDVLPVSHGLCSGWKWTALLGALINATQLEALAALSGTRSDVVNYVVQGDDIALEMTTTAAADKLLAAYASERFEVNPKKFWISNERDEFLRRVYTPTCSAGYPARMLMKLMFMLSPPPPDEGTWSDYFAKPANVNIVPSLLKAVKCRRRSLYLSTDPACTAILRHNRARTGELITQWLELIGRFQASPVSTRFMRWLYRWTIRDVTHATKVSWSVLSIILRQPQDIGGYGLNIDFLTVLSHQGEVERDTQHVLTYNMRANTEERGNPDNERDVFCYKPACVPGGGQEEFLPRSIIYPVGVQVQSPKVDDLWTLIRDSDMRQRYIRVFSKYRLTSANLLVWSQRLGDVRTSSRLAREYRQCGPKGNAPVPLGRGKAVAGFVTEGCREAGLEYAELARTTDVSAYRETPKCFRRIATLYAEAMRSVPERVRLSEPEEVMSKIVSLSGYSRTLVKKCIHVLTKPIRGMRDARLLASIPTNWDTLAQVATLCLLTVDWKRLSLARSVLSIRIWDRSLTTTAVQESTMSYFSTFYS